MKEINNLFYASPFCPSKSLANIECRYTERSQKVGSIHTNP